MKCKISEWDMTKRVEFVSDFRTDENLHRTFENDLPKKAIEDRTFSFPPCCTQENLILRVNESNLL